MMSEGVNLGYLCMYVCMYVCIHRTDKETHTGLFSFPSKKAKGSRPRERERERALPTYLVVDQYQFAYKVQSESMVTPLLP